MKGEYPVDLVLFSGYARLPSNTTAQKFYDELALVAVVDMNTGVVHNVECTMVTGLAKEFVRDIIVGYDMNRGVEELLKTLDYKYQGHLKKALSSALKMIGTQYVELVNKEK